MRTEPKTEFKMVDSFASNGVVELIYYDETVYTSGSKCLMCGTSKKPCAGRCVECGYLWYRSDGQAYGNTNWHEYDEMSYYHPEDE